MEGETRRAVVVEDDADIAALLVSLLDRAGFVTSRAKDAATGLDLIRTSQPDLVTLDLGLPDIDGIELCRRVRAFTDAYVVMLTSRLDEVDRLIGLEAGADDYLTKPFSPRELEARVSAMMRRPRRMAGAGRSAHAKAVEFRDLVADLARRTIRRGDAELALTRIEFDLFAALLREPDRAWTKRQLVTEVWGSEWSVDEHLLEVHVGNLRRKLGDPAQRSRYVQTVRGVGYRLGVEDSGSSGP